MQVLPLRFLGMQLKELQETLDMQVTDPGGYTGPPKVDPVSGKITCKNGKEPDEEGNCPEDADGHEQIDDVSTEPGVIDRKKSAKQQESLSEGLDDAGDLRGMMVSDAYIQSMGIGSGVESTEAPPQKQSNQSQKIGALYLKRYGL